MALVLLFHIPEAKKRKIRLCAARQGVAVREVAEEAFSLPLGQIAGLEGFEAAQSVIEPFDEEMLVMAGLGRAQFSGFLDALRRERVPVALKAVLTETNAHWTPAALCRELRREHEALRGGGSIHR